MRYFCKCSKFVSFIILWCGARGVKVCVILQADAGNNYFCIYIKYMSVNSTFTQILYLYFYLSVFFLGYMREYSLILL